MNFLHPNFLFGLAAVLIPVIIHLFDFRRTKKVYFSNTRLLHQVKESTKSFYNLKHLLILISRILFISALVIAFAQPYLAPRGASGLVAGNVGIFIDNSLSMTNRVSQDESGLVMAQEAARNIIELYPAGTRFVIQTAFDNVSAYGYLSKRDAKEFIAAIKPTTAYKNINNILKDFKRTREEIPPSEIIMLSDFQRTTLMRQPVEVDSTVHLILAPVIFQTTRNLLVDTAFISNPFELDKSKMNLVIRIKNLSDQLVEDVPVRLFQGERQLSVTSASVEANAFAQLNFNIGFDQRQDDRGRIVIEDFPVSFDNELFFTLRSIDKVQVAEIRGKEASRYVATVYGNRALFSFSSMSPENINIRQLENADLIVLNEMSAMSTGLIQRLLTFRRQGANILIIPGKEPDIEVYQQFVPNLRLATSEEQMELTAPDFTRPFFKNIVEKKQDNLEMPVASARWSWGTDRNALLKFIDGSPYLSEIESGLFVFASGYSNEQGGFQTNALFVPVMYRIAANSRQSLPPLFHRLTEEEIELAVDSLSPKDIVKLTRSNYEYLPDQRLKGKTLAMLLPVGELDAGHYNLVTGARTLATLSLNLPTDESDLRQVMGNDLNEFFAGAKVTIVSGSADEEIVSKISAEYQGIELWRFFLGLALLFLFIEALLIRLL